MDSKHPRNSFDRLDTKQTFQSGEDRFGNHSYLADDNISFRHLGGLRNFYPQLLESASNSSLSVIPAIYLYFQDFTKTLSSYTSGGNHCFYQKAITVTVCNYPHQ